MGKTPSRRRSALVLYVGVAYALTWLVWLPYVRAATSGRPGPGSFLHYLASLGPLVAAVLAEAYERGGHGARELLGRLADVRSPAWWIVVGLLTPLLLVPAASAAVYPVSGTWPDWHLVGITDRAPGLGPLATWALMTASYGIGEETGWRGFLLPRLQTRRSALRATLLLIPIWAGWHLPLFWFREGYVDLGVTGGIGFLVGLAAGAVLLTALFNASGGSVLVVALWHGGWNWVATSNGLQGPWVAVMSAVIMIVAVLIVTVWGARDLAPRPRQRLGGRSARRGRES